MSKLRRLGGGGGLAKQDKLGQIRGLERAASVLDSPASPDSGEMRHVPIDEVRVDPNNPRRLQITWELLQQPIEAIDNAETRKEIEDIHGLAATLRSVGQRAPIEVVRDNSILRIVFGERRYWATRVAGHATIKAIVLRQAPENIPLVQLIENIQHKHIPLYETILNIRSVIEREAERGEPIKDATDLIERTGITRPSAYRYWRYVNLPKDVDELLEARTIGTHDELTELLKHPSAKSRKEAIARYIAGGSLAVTHHEARHHAARKGPGRPKTTISLGSTRNPLVVRHLIGVLDTERAFTAVTWDDPDAVAEAWKRLLLTLEKRVNDYG